MTTSRIQALTDGVYAIAMPILVLNFRVPTIPQDPDSLRDALMSMTPKFIDYVVSFLLLAVFWTVHHRHFHWIKQVDDRLLWINIATLLFIVMIPFSTSLYGEYRNLVVAALFFEANILAVGLLKYLQWVYITSQVGLVDKSLDRRTIEVGKKVNLVTPAVSVAAMAVAFFQPDWSTLLYISVPGIIAYVRRRELKQSA